MELQLPSHSRNRKGKNLKKDIKFVENSCSTNKKKHSILTKKPKHELDQFSDEDTISDFDQSAKHHNSHQSHKISSNYPKSKHIIINSESYDSYTENDTNFPSLKITESQPLPKIFSIEEEYFYENNDNQYDQHKSSVDDFGIFVPCYKNTDSNLKKQEMCHSNSPFNPKKQHEKQVSLSTSSTYNEDKDLSNLVQFNQNEETVASSPKGQIPQISYYKLERAVSFNTHFILPQNPSNDERKRKIQISKSSSVSGFKNPLEMNNIATNNTINNNQNENISNEGQPDRHLNKKADRYGWFINEKEVMTPQKLKVLQTESVIELKREQKWIKMIKNWDYFMANKLYKIKSRIKKGIPDCLRSKVWQLLLDPESCLPKQNDCQENKRPSIQSYILIGRSKCCKTIEADLHRTMPHVKMFCDESAINSLREILHAYSNKDSEIGYYQGMAFLAAILLVYLDEVQAFWCFVNLMNGPQLQFRRLFIHKFSGLNELNVLWEKLLTMKFPKVAHNLNEEKIDPILYTPAWFLCSYLSLPFEPTLKLRIFDRTLMFGARALLSFGLTIIALNRKLLETEKVNKILLYLQHPDEHESFKDWRNVISKFDELWLTQSDYDKLFKLTNIPKFF